MVGWGEVRKGGGGGESAQKEERRRPEFLHKESAVLH